MVIFFLIAERLIWLRNVLKNCWRLELMLFWQLKELMTWLLRYVSFWNFFNDIFLRARGFSYNLTFWMSKKVFVFIFMYYIIICICWQLSISCFDPCINYSSRSITRVVWWLFGCVKFTCRVCCLMGFIDLGKIQAMSIRGFMGEFLILSADDLWSDYVTQLNDVFFLDLVDNLNEALHPGIHDMTEDRIFT